MDNEQYQMLKQINDAPYDRTDVDEETKEILIFLQTLGYIRTRTSGNHRQSRILSHITQDGKSALEQYEEKQNNKKISKNSYRISVIAIVISVVSMLINVIISLKSEIAALFRWLAEIF